MCKLLIPSVLVDEGLTSEDIQEFCQIANEVYVVREDGVQCIDINDFPL